MIFINYIDDTKACNLGVGVGLLIWLKSRGYLAGALAFGFHKGIWLKSRGHLAGALAFGNLRGKDSANADGRVRFFLQLKLGFPLI